MANEQHSENLFNEWWQSPAAPRTAGDLLIDMKDWNPAAIKTLAKAAFLAGRKTFLPIPTKEATYCDNCGEEVDPENSTETFWISVLPVDVDSANKGESAVLCKLCFIDKIVTFEGGK